MVPELGQRGHRERGRKRRGEGGRERGRERGREGERGGWEGEREKERERGRERDSAQKCKAAASRITSFPVTQTSYLSPTDKKQQAKTRQHSGLHACHTQTHT